MNVTDTLLLLFQRMPFPKSVVLHFPEEIHWTQGVSEVAPQLLRARDVQKIAAVQFLRNGRFRVTTKILEYRDELLEGSTFLFGDVPIPVTAADQPLRSVFVRDLPVEVPDVDVKSVFESFGVVHSVHPCFFREFPSVANGTRRLVMSFRGSIPLSVSVFDFPVRVYHAGQPVTCSICHESGLLPRGCPFSGLCLHCKQPGHMARDCPQPWGPSNSSSSRPVPISSAPVSSPQFVPSSVPSSSSSVPASTIQSRTVQSVLSSATVPSTSVSAPVPSVQSQELITPEEGEVVMSSDHSEADASPPRRPRPRVPSSVDYRKLVRLVLPKVKLGSDLSTVKKVCLSMVKVHKLNVSDDECARVAASVCSNA